MSSTLAMNNTTIEAFGNITNVPNNNIAKLMYYLDCVSTVIEYNDNTITNYQNYDELTIEELLAVYTLATLLNPQLFIDAKIFIVNPNLLPDSLDNQFYKIIDERIGVHVNQEIMIGGKSVKVLKVMACNTSWLIRNYYAPLNAINRMISEKKKMNYQSTGINTQYSSIIKNAPLTPIKAPKFKTQPVSTTCSSCRRRIITRTKLKFNCLACFCFLLTGVLYICVQACSDKNICCCDVIHRCPECGAFLGEYESC